MNKNDLINAIAESASIKKTEAEGALVGFLEAVEKSLAAGESIALTGFGSFSVSARAGRTVRNPQTGQLIKIPAKKAVKFRPGKKLSEAVK